MCAAHTNKEMPTTALITSVKKEQRNTDCVFCQHLHTGIYVYELESVSLLPLGLFSLYSRGLFSTFTSLVCFLYALEKELTLTP